ncbi:chemotaxis-specific protein-glutamate methyltransferase CheB [Megalodesulfovibrio paquesii]
MISASPAPRGDSTSGRGSSAETPPVRVLVVDDSACVRQALSDMLEQHGRMTVVGQAASGVQAVAQVKALHPDVVTMDFQMPDMDGLEATRHIMEECPTPIVLVSAVLNPQEATSLFMALDAGALTLLQKPRLGEAEYAASVAHLVETVQLMSEVRVVRRLRRSTRGGTKGRDVRPPARTPAQRPAHVPGGVSAGISGQSVLSESGRQEPPPAHYFDVLCIGASTGGPQALEQLLSRLDPGFPLPVLVVQHIAPGFLPGLVNWLNQTSALPVRIAQAGMPLRQGVVYFAPDTRHMVISRAMTVALEDTAPEESVKPAVNRLFRSCASLFGKRAIGVLLTGMGRDGAVGLKELKIAGAMTIAQDEGSCIVFGMPAQAVKLGAVQKVLPLQEIPGFLNWLTLGR